MTLESINPFEREAWRQSPQYSPAVCPEHYWSRLVVRAGTVPERLDQVLRSSNRLSLTALGRYLAKLQEPYGKWAEVSCSHGYHSSRRWRAIPSLQEFLLRTIPWIPVRGDPEGREFRTPDQAWVLTLDGHRRLLLPQADLDETTCSKLQLPFAARPQRAALEAGLQLLSDLVNTPDELWGTADWLLEQLERSLRDVQTVVAPEHRRSLPSFTGEGRTWTTEPLVPDLPGLGSFQSLSVLPKDAWPNLRRVYGLRPASELIDVSINADRSGARPPPILSESDRVELVAYLDSQDGRLEDLARLVGRLEQIPCTALQLTMTYEDETVAVRRTHYLARTVQQEGRSRVARGQLFTTSDPPLDEIAQDLAMYLQRPNLAKDIHLYLLGRQSVLKKLTKEDLEIAAQALLKYPFQADLTDEEPEEESPPPGTQAPTPPGAKSQTGTGTAERTGGAQTSAEGSRSGTGPTGASAQQTDGRGAGQGARPSDTATRRPTSATVGGTSGAAGESGGGRNRMVSYIEPPDHERGSEDPERTERRSAIDESGVAAVVDFEILQGRTPTVLPAGHPGFDIRSGSLAAGGDRLIEVKSLDGAWDAYGVGLTTTQFQTAQSEGGAYWLYVVEHARSASPIVHPIQDPAGQVSTFRLDQKWSALSSSSAETRRRPPGVLTELEAASFDDALPLFEAQSLGDAAPQPIGWVRCPGTSRSTHFVTIVTDTALEPLAVVGEFVCIKAGSTLKEEGVRSLVSIREQGQDGTESVYSVRTCWPELDGDGSLAAVVLKANEGSGVPPMIVDDPSRLQIHGSFVGVISRGAGPRE